MSHKALDREFKSLENDLADGNISTKEYNAATRELEQSYRCEAEASATEAYETELERW